MGMSASQARLLFITSRMNDIELKSQQISNTKMRLAAESEQVANAYTTALNKTMLKVTDPMTQTSSQLTYNAIMSPGGIMSGGYNLQTVDGKVVVSNQVAAAFEKSRGGSFRVDTSQYQNAYNQAVQNLNIAQSTLSTYLDSKGVTVNNDGTLKFPTKTIIIPGTVNPTEGTSSAGGAGGTGGAGTVPTTDGTGSAGGAGGVGGTGGAGRVGTTEGTSSAGGAGGTSGVNGSGRVGTTDGVSSAGGTGGSGRISGGGGGVIETEETTFSGGGGIRRMSARVSTDNSVTVDNRISTNFLQFNPEGTGGTTGGARWNGALDTGLTTDTNRIIPNRNFDFSSVINADSRFTIDNVNVASNGNRIIKREVYTNAEKQQITAQYNIYAKDVADAQAEVNRTKTELDNANASSNVNVNMNDYSSEFYQNLFKQMETNGYVAYDQKLLNNPEALQNQLSNGNWYLGKKNEDGKYAQTSISSSTMITEEVDKRDMAKAEAEYNAQTLKINNKEKKLDNQLKTLDTEHSALSTESESIKSLIKDNVDKSFNLFS